MSQLPIPTPPYPWPRRETVSHKGTYGRVLVVAGSRGMAGAAVLAGSAAVRGGAGIVQVACPNEVLATVAAGNPCYLTAGIHHHADGTYSESSISAVVELAKSANAIAIGPGLGNRKDVAALVWGLLRAAPETPIIVDADGLNVIAPLAGEFVGRSAPLVLTPHPGEFSRLTRDTVASIQADRTGKATAFAKRFRVILALKGHATVVTDGSRVYQNTTGNPGMATGGTGDVLTGLLAALYASGMTGYEATALGVWIHGRAGDLAARELSQTALNAWDLVQMLPLVFRELESS
ncbi:MAG: NAD(P)H-hydrate dehydratase [Bacteroidales bacterium]|nr:NAD(P)H-hydrate dehydratase [Bacteroidales bacterium]